MLSKTLKNIKNICFYASLMAILASLSACVKNTNFVGYTIDDSKLDQIKVGKTRKALVKRELGSPSAKSIYGDEVWYYISTEYESVAFFKPKVKDQEVLALSFNQNQTVKTIDKFSRSDIESVNISAEKTPTQGHDIGVLEQLLGNVGRFNSESRDLTKPR